MRWSSESVCCRGVRAARRHSPAPMIALAVVASVVVIVGIADGAWPARPVEIHARANHRRPGSSPCPHPRRRFRRTPGSGAIICGIEPTAASRWSTCLRARSRRRCWSTSPTSSVACSITRRSRVTSSPSPTSCPGARARGSSPAYRPESGPFGSLPIESTACTGCNAGDRFDLLATMPIDASPRGRPDVQLRRPVRPGACASGAALELGQAGDRTRDRAERRDRRADDHAWRTDRIRAR